MAAALADLKLIFNGSAEGAHSVDVDARRQVRQETLPPRPAPHRRRLPHDRLLHLPQEGLDCGPGLDSHGAA